MNANGTWGTFKGFKCIILLVEDGLALLEFHEKLPDDAVFGWLGHNSAHIFAVDPYKMYWWDTKEEFVPEVTKKENIPWAFGFDHIARATYRGVPCKIIPNRGRVFVLEFETKPENIGTWKGTQKEVRDPEGILPDRYYHYIGPEAPPMGALVLENHHGFNCVECNGRNEHAEANLSKSRFICWGCSDTWRWKYAEDFLPDHRYYKQPAPV